jgi:hypothetical protein
MNALYSEFVLLFALRGLSPPPGNEVFAVLTFGPLRQLRACLPS